MSSFPTQPILATSTITKHTQPPSHDNLAFLLDKSKTIHHLHQIHAYLIRHSHENDTVLRLKLQKAYSTLNHLHHSITLFKATQNPDVFFYTSIIHSHSLHNLHQQALSYYIEMLSQEINPNPFTFSSLLKSCPIQTAKPIHSHMIKLGFQFNKFVGTTLIDVYAKEGEVSMARKLFDIMPERSLITITTMITGYAKNTNVNEARILFNKTEVKDRDVICWNAMIDGYVQQGKPSEALTLFREMLLAKVKANEVTILAVLSACGQTGALNLGRWVHTYVKNNRISISVHLSTALIDMYSKCGSLEDARLIFNSMNYKDVVAYNSMIVGYAMHGFGLEALKLFNLMTETGLQPTDITFIGILNACAHAGLVSQGWDFFNLMSDKFKIKPKIEHYGCMINLLGRAGHLNEAYNLIKNMKINPDPILLWTLLNACSVHKNIILAEEIFNFLVKHDITNPGSFVLLSNMYALDKNWEKVGELRKMMKKSGIQKEPGCSSIEVNNKVHEFLADDINHVKSKEIYLMINDIDIWLKRYGYSPKLDGVLRDIDENEKVRSLQVHSERLAIAFGLISTEPGSTIKIVKNLRVCSDCHDVIKLLSKITGRKIIVRDRTRFHHFVDGECSCGEYW